MEYRLARSFNSDRAESLHFANHLQLQFHTTSVLLLWSTALQNPILKIHRKTSVHNGLQRTATDSPLKSEN